MSQIWETVVATALMGTERKTPDLSGGEGALGNLLAQLHVEEVSGQLLGAASAIAVSNQAGIQPAEFQGQRPVPCGEDSQPTCDEPVHRVLQTVLNGTHSPVLPELLHQIQQSGQRVSERSLPPLLNLGRQRKDLRIPIRNIIGKRGQWLAQHNPDWAYIQGEIDVVDAAGALQTDLAQAQWETGTQATRLALLEMLRQMDTKFALDLLASGWKQEQAKDRAAFLHCLEPQLSLDDEDFLEAALKDRSKEVRAIAADLLAHLPTSQLCLRMTERVKSFIAIQTTPTGLAMEITLPKTDETGDGLIAEKSRGLGQRSSLLMQIVGAVPLTDWEHLPSALIEAASQQDSQTALLLGWQIAAQRQQDQHWAKALLSHYYDDASKGVATNLTSLAKILPQPDRETSLSAWLARLCQQKQWAEWRQSIASVVQANPNPSLTFSQALIQYFQIDFKADLAMKSKKYPYHLRSLIQDLGYYLHPESYSDAMDMVNQFNDQSLDDPRQTLLEDWIEILSFRQSVTQLFTRS